MPRRDVDETECERDPEFEALIEEIAPATDAWVLKDDSVDPDDYLFDGDCLLDDEIDDEEDEPSLAETPKPIPAHHRHSGLQIRKARLMAIGRAGRAGRARRKANRYGIPTDERWGKRFVMSYTSDRTPSSHRRGRNWIREIRMKDSDGADESQLDELSPEVQEKERAEQYTRERFQYLGAPSIEDCFPNDEIVPPDGVLLNGTPLSSIVGAHSAPEDGKRWGIEDVRDVWRNEEKSRGNLGSTVEKYFWPGDIEDLELAEMWGQAQTLIDRIRMKLTEI